MSVSAVTVTPEIRHRLDTEGFYIFEDIFTAAEMADVIARIEAFQRRHEESLRERGGTEGISRADEITFTSHLAEADDALRAFCTRPEFVALTTQLLGPDTDLYWNQAVFKHPDGTQQFPWHQDDGYTPVYHHDHPNAMTLKTGVFSLVGGN